MCARIFYNLQFIISTDLYNFNDEYFINLGVMSSEWIKQQHKISIKN